MEIFERLQNWYLNQCNDEWEHQYGVMIDTIDNPGWKVAIDLEATPLESRPFDSIKIERTDDDWISCRTNAQKFEGFGGPTNLKEVLEIFLNWAEFGNEK